ncbi:hypothetical protein BN12_4060015 [Nostocoides japonicum T1-X7]|uniref:Transposase IS110-like N-terminal domain-containing protein n=1 Tax=Nostocoides japonicum T1-X7 TaxID=1194083 RepID=A0A077M559_9MICO|nr:hypothetical protein BN12_4060015 [Tetrasphaera japonica T1-X7]
MFIWRTRWGREMFEYRRVKNDERDAADLADLLRMGRLPEAWIAPPATRELRELVRHRAKRGPSLGCGHPVSGLLSVAARSGSARALTPTPIPTCAPLSKTPENQAP